MPPVKQDTDSTALHEIEIEEWKEKLRRQTEKYKDVLADLRKHQTELANVLQLQDDIAAAEPARIEQTVHGRMGESTAVAVASDWHIEERVEKASVNGVNEYTLAIARARCKRFFQRLVSMVEKERTRTKIDKLVLALLGDFISGSIHDDLAESNQLSPTEAVLMAFEWIEGGIDFLLRYGKFKIIIVPCCAGNHGRTTQRPRVSTATKNSFEVLLYRFLAKRYENEPRVRFVICDGYHVFLDVYRTRIRFHHGDWVRYHGGVGGLTIPLNKAIAAWNKTIHADIDVLGHWHTTLWPKNAVVNGSGIGYNAFAISIKADFEVPQQTLFLVHPDPRRGKTVHIPIFLD